MLVFVSLHTGGSFDSGLSATEEIVKLALEHALRRRIYNFSYCDFPQLKRENLIKGFVRGETSLSFSREGEQLIDPSSRYYITLSPKKTADRIHSAAPDGVFINKLGRYDYSTHISSCCWFRPNVHLIFCLHPSRYLRLILHAWASSCERQVINQPSRCLFEPFNGSCREEDEYGMI